jgi:hypothetical protein
VCFAKVHIDTQIVNVVYSAIMLRPLPEAILSCVLAGFVLISFPLYCVVLYIIIRNARKGDLRGAFFRYPLSCSDYYVPLTFVSTISNVSA